MNPVVAKLVRADGTIEEIRGEAVDLFGLPFLRFDGAVNVMQGDTLHLEPVVRLQPPSASLN